MSDSPYQIVRADLLDALPNIAAGSVPLIVTSPPYNRVQIQWRGGVGVFPILLCGPHLRPRVSL